MDKLSRFGTTNKYWSLCMLYLGFCVAYIDRTVINISLSAIGQEFEVSPATLGVVLSAFFIGYTVMQVPGGMIG